MTTDQPHTPTQTKPPPIFIKANVIELLRQLLKENANNNYTIKQLPDNQIKFQINTSDTSRKVVKTFKENGASFQTYPFKKDKNYKIVLKAIHPKLTSMISHTN